MQVSPFALNRGKFGEGARMKNIKRKKEKENQKERDRQGMGVRGINKEDLREGGHSKLTVKENF